MNTLISQGIKITVKNIFNKELSNIHENIFFHNYEIEIENLNHQEVKLISRKWEIYDSLNYPIIVEGKGVIGKQPNLAPNDTFKYISGCKLQSEIGYMEGKYLFINQITKEKFEVKIPKFELIYPFRLN
jgi:ApaG protein